MGRRWSALLLGGVVLASAREALANPVVVLLDSYGGTADPSVLLSAIGCSLLVEYVAVRLLLPGQDRPLRIVKAFALVNLVTVPLTQLLGMAVMWLAELLPLLIEPSMYRTFLGHRPRGLFWRIAVANLLGFAFGLFWYHELGPLIRDGLGTWRLA